MIQFWLVRLVTFLLWAALAASTAFWVFQGLADSSAPAKQTGASSAVAKSGSSGAGQDLMPQVAKVLGATAPVVETAASQLAAAQARFQLLGILAVGSKKGAALLSVDGQPAKPYSVGVAIEQGLEVLAVAPRSVSIGSNGQTAFTLELPLKN